MELQFICVGLVMESKKERLTTLLRDIKDNIRNDYSKSKFISLLENEISLEESIKDDNLYLRDIRNVLNDFITDSHYSFMIQFSTAVNIELCRS